jgi:hypothetical protein
MVRPVVRRPCGGGRARRGTAPTPIRILLDAARSFVPPARSPLVTPSYTVILSACHALRDQRGAGGHACQQQNVPALCRPVQRTWSSLSLSFSLHLCISLFLGIVPARACARHPVRLSAVVDARARAVQASPGRPCPAVSLPSLGSPTSFVPRHRRIFRMFPRKAWIIRRALLINLGSFSARCGKSSGIQDPRRRVIVDELACVTNESHYDLQRTCGQPRCHL